MNILKIFQTQKRKYTEQQMTRFLSAVAASPVGVEIYPNVLHVLGNELSILRLLYKLQGVTDVHVYEPKGERKQWLMTLPLSFLEY